MADRCGAGAAGLIHHSDLSMRCTNCLADADVAPSVGSRGDSHDSVLTESVKGLVKAEVICRKGPLRNLEAWN
jgi:hypothetical protein